MAYIKWMDELTKGLKIVFCILFLDSLFRLFFGRLFRLCFFRQFVVF